MRLAQGHLAEDAERYGHAIGHGLREGMAQFAQLGGVIGFATGT
jgi:hypothetical protein